MYKGFYNLTSAMLTSQRNLNVVSNNLVNISTTGYKEDRYTATTFDDVMMSRTGNQYKAYTDIGRESYIRASSNIYINYDQGTPEPTNLPLDFAIVGDGFFAVRRESGETAYTRAGDFSLDDAGYLCCPGQGRVLDPQGREIRLYTDKITADEQGNCFDENGGFLGQIGVYSFEDTAQLEHDDQGMFTGAEGQAMDSPTVYWKYLERSNVDMVRQMTEMLTVQRALQSAAQATKMYDSLMNRAVNDVGRLQ